MNYHLKNKPKHEHRRKIISALVLFLVLSVSGLLFPNLLRSSLYAIGKPLWFTSSSIGVTFVKIKDFFVFKSTLVSDNLKLKDEISSLKLKEIDYDSLIKENQDLKNQLGRKITNSRLTAKVLSRPPQSPYDTFVIDIGTVEGVVNGSKVYLSDNIILGTVVNVTNHTSLVELFSTGNHKQQAILSRTGVSFEAVGDGGANFNIEVPKDTDVLWGDSFVYPGTSYVLGNVYYIDTSSQSSFKIVHLRIPGNIFSSQWFFVEKTTVI